MNDIYKELLVYCEGELIKKRKEFTEKKIELSKCINSKKSIVIMSDLSSLRRKMQDLRKAIKIYRSMD